MARAFDANRSHRIAEICTSLGSSRATLSRYPHGQSIPAMITTVFTVGVCPR